MTTVVKRCINRLMKGYRRNNQGQFVKVPFSQSKFGGLFLLILTVSLGAFIDWLYSPVELARPISGSIAVHAVEPAPQPIVEPPSEKEQILSYIVEKFGDDADKMITIIGTCENGTWDQSRTNTNRNGTKDWGLAQINDANSKLCSGLDFRNSWKDNLECAHRVYKSQGLSAWSCSHKVGIKPFYMKGAK